MGSPRSLAAIAAAFAVCALAFPSGQTWPFWLACATVAVLLTLPLSRLDTTRLGPAFVSLAVAAAVISQTGDHERELLTLLPELGVVRAHLASRALLVLGLVALLPLRGAWRAIPIVALVLAVAGFVALSILDLRNGPPDIDVYEMHLEALARFWRGECPYSGSFRNIYPHDAWYGPGLVVDGRVQIGFAYPPLSFLLALVGERLGDFRLGYLIAASGATLLFAAAGGTAGRAGAVLYLLYPRHVWVIHQSWTEPVFVLGLAGVLWAAMRKPRALPLMLGLFWATKQYAALLLPLVPFLFPGRTWSHVLRALLWSFVVAAVLYVPFFAWDPRGFMRSVVMYQLWQPFRYDSLGFLGWWVQQGHRAPGNEITFGALALGLALGLGLAPRSVLGFCAGSALALFLFFAFAKQAFMNYYYCCVGVLAGLVSTSLGRRP